ncbi:MAG: response regulator transcription factor [Proteobacteria bacterium]|nr:MAG: response regulator transcription factor [Pseudomonadota bacterium]
MRITKDFGGCALANLLLLSNNLKLIDQARSLKERGITSDVSFTFQGSRKKLSLRPGAVIVDLEAIGEAFLRQILKFRAGLTFSVPFIFVFSKSVPVNPDVGMREGDSALVSPIDIVDLVSCLIDVNSTYSYAAEEFRYPITLIPGRHSAIISGSLIDLTVTEYRILSLLLSNPGKTVTFDHLRMEVWNDLSIKDSTLKTFVSQLRQKIPTLRYLLRTIPNYGYSYRPFKASAVQEGVKNEI